MRSRPFFWSVDPFFNLFMVILLFLNPIQRLTKQHHSITAPKFHPTIQLDRSVKISECSGCIKTSGASASFNNYQPTQLCHGSKPWPRVRFSANVAEPVTKALAKPQSFIPILWGWDKVVLLYYIERWENIRNIQFHRCNFSFFQQTAWIYSIRLSWIFAFTAAPDFHGGGQGCSTVTAKPFPNSRQNVWMFELTQLTHINVHVTEVTH